MANAEVTMTKFFADVILFREAALNDLSNVWLESVERIDPVIVIRSNDSVFFRCDSFG